MLKKLQSLLFEDEEDEEIVEDEDYEEEEIEEEPVEVKPAPRRWNRRAQKQPEPEPQPEPVYTAPEEPVKPAKPAKPVMNRVEVTKTIPVQRVPENGPRTTSVFSSGESVFKRPAQVTQPASRPVFEPKETAPAPDPVPVSSFGISADQRTTNIRPAAEAARKRVQAEKPSGSRRPAASSVYEFRPVISPMFGVDEKDMQSVQYAPKPDPQAAVKPVHESAKVISPIYGATEKAPAPGAGRPMNDSPAAVDNGYFSRNQQKEEEKGFPEFSLDDILSARDEEFSRQVYSSPEATRTPDIDETVVIDTNRFSPFDQQTLDFDRNK